METAMQKLKNKLTNQLSFSKVSDIQSILDYINEEGIKNEKELVENSFRDGYLACKYDGDTNQMEYYDKLYNQNKE